MLTTERLLVVRLELGLRLGLDLVSGCLDLMHTCRVAQK